MPRRTSESEDPSKSSPEDKGEMDGSASQSAKASSSSNDMLMQLKQAHHEITDLLDTINKTPPGRQKEIVQRLKKRWLQHSKLEEDLLLPELEKRNINSAELLEAEIERDLAKVLIVNLHIDENNNDEIDNMENTAKLRVLDRLIRQIFETEEKPESGLLDRINALNISELENKISNFRLKSAAYEAAPPDLLYLSFNEFIPNMENPMTYRERDAQGRFVSEDTRRYGSQSQRRDYDPRRDERRMTSRDYDEDNRGRSYGRMREDDERRYGRREDDYSRDRDERRMMGRDYEEERRGRYSGRMREDDERRFGRREEDYGHERGHGGWFGDPQGHAEAARRGWEERRSMEPDYDDERRRSYGRMREDDEQRYGRREEEDYGHERGHGGWFGDHEGHSEAARRGWRHRH